VIAASWTVQLSTLRAELVSLPWDSQMLGLTCARMEKPQFADGLPPAAHPAALRQALDAARERGINHLLFRINSADIFMAQVCTATGFYLVDAIVTFGCTLPSEPKPPEQAHWRLAESSDAEVIADLARQTFTLDRFHNDPAIARARADEIHATWARNSVLGQAADAVVVAEDASGIAAFVTCKLIRGDANPRGVIPLVGTAERARGQGLGRRLTQAAIGWFAAQGCREVEVGTQLQNIAASRLYESCGFRVSRSALSFHWHAEGSSTLGSHD
jgi:dTDP-4-amino-4,6-dideoxy-D-galactose acyltransferase